MSADPFDAVLDARSEARYTDDPRAEPDTREVSERATRRVETISRLLLSRLSDAEYAYMVQRGGEDYAERAYGVSYER